MRRVIIVEGCNHTSGLVNRFSASPLRSLSQTLTVAAIIKILVSTLPQLLDLLL
jgi:hypothetical protein